MLEQPIIEANINVTNSNFLILTQINSRILRHQSYLKKVTRQKVPALIKLFDLLLDFIFNLSKYSNFYENI